MSTTTADDLYGRQVSSSRRRLAEALIKDSQSTAPIQSWTQGMARLANALVGGYQLNQLADEERAKEQATTDMYLKHPALQASTPAAVSQNAGYTPSTVTSAPMPAVNTANKIYTNDEPSPLDPPSGADRDMAIRTIVAESGNQPAVGQQAVASVIRNRAVAGNYGGDTAGGVVRAPNQFEPWNTEAGRSRMAAIDPNSAQYRSAGAALDAAYTGADPTNGALNFYAPKAQAALGRPAPSWAVGRQGQQIADHTFFGGANDPGALPPSAMPAQGFAIPGQPQPTPQPAQSGYGMTPQIQSYVRDLIRNPATRAAGLQLLGQYSKPGEAEFGQIGENADGSKVMGWIDKRTRQISEYTRPGSGTPADSVIPQAPSGIDPKVWRQEQSERYTRGQLPASFEDEAKLRGEITQLPSYKNLAQAAPVYRSMVDAAGRDDRGSDVNLIYGFAKVMDPGSVVRESEMSVAQAISTLPQQLQQTIQSQLQGVGRLSPDVRAAIMREAQSRLQAYQGMYNQDAEMFGTMVQGYRADPARVIPRFGELPVYTPPAAPQAAPAATPAQPQQAAPKRMVWDPKTGKLVAQ